MKLDLLKSKDHLSVMTVSWLKSKKCVVLNVNYWKSIY